ncbi:hypothetical protein MPER_13150 [Moniliophthora perniciosa FA553]|nr:hypothetical protein MPER_13150 [Moniliophthora perniciosa FA553]
MHSFELPALPKINSKEIERQIFTHRSVYGRPTHIFEDLPNDPNPDNEKFEHLGDSVLSLVVTDLLLEMCPGLRVGPSTKIRAMIVANQTLATISQRYKLPHRLSVHPAQAEVLKMSIHASGMCVSISILLFYRLLQTLKTFTCQRHLADVFEAFVGGLYIDQGLQAVQSWLNPLFRPYVEIAYNTVRTQYGLVPLTISTPPASPSSTVTAMNTQGSAEHLTLFNKRVAGLNKQIEWVPLPIKEAMPSTAASSIPAWHIKAVVDGETYGEGKGMTEAAAKNEAAKVALAKLTTHFFTLL